jgi:hypothetical protein
MVGERSYTYQVAIIDGAGGIGQAGPSVMVRNAPARVSRAAYVKLTWNWPTGSVPLAAVYRDGRLIGVTGHQSFVDIGQKEVSNDPNIPALPPLSGLAEHLRSRITAVSAANVTLAIAASSSVKDATVFSDDAGLIQAAIDKAESQGGISVSGPSVQFPLSVLTVATSIVTGTRVAGLSLVGRGAMLCSQIVEGPVLIIGGSYVNDVVHRLFIRNLAFMGSGYSDTRHPGQDGVWIFGSNGVYLQNDDIENFPHIGILGEKPGLPGGGGFWTEVSFDYVRARYFGDAAVQLGFSHMVDDVHFQRLFVSGAGIQVPFANGQWGAVYIRAANPFLQAVNVESVQGFAVAMHITGAHGGVIVGAHFENNGAGATEAHTGAHFHVATGYAARRGTDLFIDESTGLAASGIEVNENAGTANYGVALGGSSSGNSIIGVAADDTTANTFTCVVNLNNQPGNLLEGVSVIGPRPNALYCGTAGSLVEDIKGNVLVGDQLRFSCTHVIGLPKANVPAGAVRCVTDWNGSAGPCHGNGGNYDLALYNGSRWMCR